MGAEQVFIEFISDTTQLKPATDALEEQGKVTKKNSEEFKKANAELLKQQKALEDIGKITKKIDETGKVTKKNLADLAKIVKSQSAEFQKDIQSGIIEALKEAGIEAEKFNEILDNVADPSLKQRLRQMTEELAKLKVEGKDNTQRYKELAKEAGNLKDAIADANQEIKNFGSDTSNIDGIIGIAQGVAGGFAVAQGAVALFGDENEELQKTLLKVNAVMAVLQGLQQIQITLQKESAAAMFANTIATRAQAVAQAAFNFVVGTSTGLLRVFRIALASTGVGLLVLGLVELVKVLNKTDTSLENANAELERQKNLIEAINEGIESRLELEEAQLRTAGKAESEIVKAQGRSLLEQRKALVESNQILASQRDGLDNTSEAWAKLNTQIFLNNKEISGIDNKITIKQLDLQKQLADEREEAAKKAAEEAQKRQEEAKAQRIADLEAFKARQELNDLQSEQGSEEQLTARKKLLQASLLLELENEKLTSDQRKLLIQQYFADRKKLEQDFRIERDRLILEDIQSDVQAELQGLNITNERKLELTEAAIQIASQIEIDAAKGNAEKITEIEAKRDKQIRDARLQSIQETLNYELSLTAAQNGPRVRRLQQVAADAEQERKIRIDAINEIERIDSNAIQKKIEALNREREQGLISQKDYNLQYAELIDDQTQVYEDAAKKRDEINEQSNQKAKQKAIELTQTILEAASQVVSVLDSLYQLQADKENQALDAQKAKLDALKEAGAITEKEAQARQKKLEAEERRIRQQQAEREKRVAVFNAGLAIPQAVLKGLTTGGPILAAIYGALAAAQFAITAARPIPKFGKGKKDRYEGLGEVGETGTELIEHNGRMYVADKPQIVWLSKQDKVFNPQETAAMMSKPSLQTERPVLQPSKKETLVIDYKRLGKEIAKHNSTNVYVDGVKEQHIQQQQFTRWQNKRRSF